MSIFIQNIHDLQTYLRANSVECELLYGATPADKTEAGREEIIKQFHQPNFVALFLKLCHV
jgi:hypothetical protein